MFQPNPGTRLAFPVKVLKLSYGALYFALLNFFFGGGGAGREGGCFRKKERGQQIFLPKTYLKEVQ